MCQLKQSSTRRGGQGFAGGVSQLTGHTRLTLHPIISLSKSLGNAGRRNSIGLRDYASVKLQVSWSVAESDVVHMPPGNINYM